MVSELSDYAIVAPSINAHPEALERISRMSPDVLLIIIGDMKAPPELRVFCERIGAYYLGVDEQMRLPFKTKNHLAWNSIMRRNLGFLEAMRLGANVIVSVDDDNYPIRENWFSGFVDALSGAKSFPLISCDSGWFNVGDYATQAFYYRGFPYTQRGRVGYQLAGMTNKIGIANGLIYDDPDINATERIEKNPKVTSYSLDVLRGLAVAPGTLTPINSQNTAYRKEVFPLCFVLPDVGRYDDIWASYIAQVVMGEEGYSVCFGRPTVSQQRNEHNTYRDLANELYGMEFTESFVACLKAAPLLSSAGILGNLEVVAQHLKVNWRNRFPFAFLDAWISDVDGLS